MIKMTNSNPAEQLNKNLKYEIDKANETIETQKTLISDLTARLNKVVNVVDAINKAKYKGRIRKYVDPNKVTDIRLDSMDVDELEQMADTFTLLKKKIAGIDFDVPDTRPSLLTVPSRFKYGVKPTD